MSEELAFPDAAAFDRWLTRHHDRHEGIWITPRRPRSRWSRVNIAKVEALTAAGRMRPPGRAEVDAAKADGRWDDVG